MAHDDRPVTGEWYFELSSVVGVEALPAATAAAAAVLHDTQLLIPRRLTLSNWIRPAGSAFAPSVVGEVEVAVSGDLSAADVEGAIDDARASHDDPGAVPHVTVSGDTLIVEQEGEGRIESGLLTLRAAYDGVGLTVYLSTRGTAWLPFDLAGRPQPNLAAANAPRLRRSLRRLAQRLEAEVNPGAPTRYAVPTRDGLDNHRHVGGGVADVTR